MYCIVIEDKKITNYSSIYELLKLKTDSLFVIDYDAIRRRYLNLKLYDELAKYFEITVMNYPETESDLVDTFVNGASNVVINNNLTYKTISRYLAFSQNIAMKYRYNDTCIYFSEKGGNMYLAGQQIMLPYVFAYLYNGFELKNSAMLVGFPPELE